jgi:hypothetical protein
MILPQGVWNSTGSLNYPLPLLETPFRPQNYHANRPFTKALSYPHLTLPQLDHSNSLRQ